MKNDEMKTFVENLQTKIGNEASALIQDDLAILISDTNNTNKTIEDKDKEIITLNERNENLQKVNSNLFQQVGIGKEETKPKQETEPSEPFSFKTVFDEKGNFIK